jgi:hypothetical protein
MGYAEVQDWKELSAAYLIGRGMWSGDNMMLTGLYGIAGKAFENDNSPWKKISLKKSGIRPPLRVTGLYVFRA